MAAKKKDESAKAGAPCSVNAGASGTLRVDLDGDAFRAIAEYTYDWESWIGLDGCLKWVNRSVERLTGYSVEDCLAMEDYPLPIVAPEDRERMRQKFEENVANDVEFRITRKNGADAWVAASWQSVWDAEGNPIGCRISTRDIGDRMRMQEALSRSEHQVRQKLEVILAPQGDIGLLELTDIVDIDALQRLMDAFYAITHVGIGIIDMNGRVLVATGWQDICTKFHRVHPESCRNCVESDVELSSGVESGQFKLYRCKNNMWDIATPIVINGKHLGNIFLGQFLFEDEEPDFDVFREQARRYGFDEAAYLETLQKVPRWSREKVNAVMHFYSRLAGIISLSGYSSLRLARVLSEREKLLSSIRESEEKYRLLVENQNDLVIKFDREGRILYANPKCCETFGKPETELRDVGFLPFIYEDDRRRMDESIEGVWHVPREAYHEVRALTAGGLRWFGWVVKGVADGDGSTNVAIAVGRDITDKKQAEKDLRESETKFRTLFDRATDGILIADAETRKFLSGNKAICGMLGYALDEIEGLGVEDIHPPGSLPSVIGHFDRQVLEMGVAPDVPVKRKDGSVFFADINSSIVTLAGKQYLMGIFRDITVRKEAERALRESEERFRSLVTLLPQTVYEADAEGKITFVNKAAVEIFGYAVEEYRDMRIAQLICEKDAGRVRDAVGRVLAGETVGANEYRVKRKDGSEACVIVQSCAITDADGNVTGLRGIVIDITERKLAEQALRESQERLATVFRASPVGIGITRVADGFLVEANDTLARILGYERDEIVGHTTFELGLWAHPEDRERLYAKLREGGRLLGAETQFRTKSGTPIDVLISMEEIVLHGERCGLGMLIDITERKRMERKLRESETLLTSTIESTADGILVVNGEGRVKLANKKFAEMWRIPGGMIDHGDDEELLGYVLAQIGEPEAFLDKVRKLYASREVSFDTVDFKDGRIFERLSSPLILGNEVSGRVWSFRDVTERKRAEAALRMEHERLISIFDSIGEAIYVSDIDTNEILYANRALKELLGCDPMGKECFRVLQNRDAPCAFCSNAILRKLKGRPYRWEFHNPVMGRDFVLFDRLISWPDGRDVRFEMAIDITDRKQAEASLKESEERYRNLFEAANDAIFIIEAGSGTILDANARCAALSGKSVARLKGMDHAELYPAEEREHFRGVYAEPDGGEREFVRLVHVEHADGYEIPVQISARYAHIGGSGLFLAIYRDITELKDIERAMRSDEAGLANLVSERTMELGRALRDLENARRLADIGTLAATVAHELRNPLGVISTAIYNIKSKTQDARLDKHIANIEKKVVESDRIIGNLLSYARVKAPALSEVCIGEMLEEALEHLMTKFSDLDVVVERVYACPEGSRISVDRDQISELVTNLLDNAYQAVESIEKGRKLVLGCERVENRCHIWIEDNGEGMTKAQLSKIFEPFFSTRAKGIGLGLALCKQIVQLHGGDIAMTSELGKGSRVDVYLPVR